VITARQIDPDLRASADERPAVPCRAEESELKSPRAGLLLGADKGFYTKHVAELLAAFALLSQCFQFFAAGLASPKHVG
jgi:hypothetical protein